MPKVPTKGQVYECRVARLLHHEGAFVRRAVDLRMQFGEAFTVTDIDILALTTTGSMQPRVAIGECKTTESKGAPSHGDRLLWVSGVRQLVPAAASHFLATTKTASDNVRALSQQLGADILDARDVAHRERVLGLDPDGLEGPHDPSLITLQDNAYRVAKSDDELRRVWSFVRSEFWFAEPTYGLKRTFGALRLLTRRWHRDLPAAEAEAIRWIAEEAVGAALVGIVELAGEAYRQPPQVFDRVLASRLSEGVASHQVLDQLSAELDRYVMAILREAGADPSRQLDHLGALKPTLPGYAESLREVLHRVAEAPKSAIGLTRLYDENLAAQRGSAVPPGLAIVPSNGATRLLKTISLFLQKQVRVPEPFLEALAGSARNENSTKPNATTPDDSASDVVIDADGPASRGTSDDERAPTLFETQAKSDDPALTPTGRFGLFSTTLDDESKGAPDALWLEVFNGSDLELEFVSGSGDASHLGKFSTEHPVQLPPRQATRLEFALRVPAKDSQRETTLEFVQVSLALRDQNGTSSDVYLRATQLTSA